jgi:hypothetical protein
MTGRGNRGRRVAILGSVAAIGLSGLVSIVGVFTTAGAQTTTTSTSSPVQAQAATASCVIVSNGGTSYTATGRGTGFAGPGMFTWSGVASAGPQTSDQFTFTFSGPAGTYTENVSTSDGVSTATGSCTFTIAAVVGPQFTG